MLNTRDLEKRWLIYKIKSYIPHAIITISLIVIISLLTLFITKKKEIKTTTEVKMESLPTLVKTLPKVNNEPIVLVKEEKKIIIKQPIPEPIILDEATLKLKPSLGFMKKIQNSTLPYYQTEPSYDNMTTDMKKEDDTTKEQISQEPVNTPVTIIKEEQIQKSKITIERRDTRDDIKNIIKRFKKNNNPALSLFIAKKYYELGEYHKSYNYALITNQINRDIEASWIVFSKSLVKLGEKEMAINTLKDYIKNSHSNNAKLLLEEINSGKFK